MFRHKILEFALWPSPYVSHSWNRNSWFQNTGTFFISLAPIIVSTLVIYILKETIFAFLFLPFFAIASAPSNKDIRESLKYLPCAFLLFVAVFTVWKLKPLFFGY